MNSSTHHVIDPPALQVLFNALRRRGYDLIGPTIHDNAVAYDRIMNVEDMPVGWGDEQESGKYRLRKLDNKAIFGYNLGPHSWKKFLFPPALKLLTSDQTKDGLVFVNTGNGAEPHADRSAESKPGQLAFIGVRSCELHAILVQDKVFSSSQFVDSYYTNLRKQAFIVAVNCTQSAATCFCASMETGPKADSGFDLCLTEVLEKGVHHLLVQVGSPRGEEILKDLPHRDATERDRTEASRAVERTGESMKRQMVTKDLKSLLQQNLEHRHWDVVANRCLCCANCTMVCPTCFCHSVEDTTDLSGSHAERRRKWDSCYTSDFSYIHGGSIRVSSKSRYRQWLTHKLANWFDQFGTSGCVGCGRCIAWCPVGIDITEEVSSLRKLPNVQHSGKTATPTTT